MESLFREKWAPLTAGILIGFLNTMLFMVDSPWSVFAGLRNWGLHIMEFLGFPDVAQVSPFEQVSSIMDMAFLLGAFGAAMLAKDFIISIPPLREAVKGILGGILMGIGANFSRGCTVGGFYSSISALSVSGLFMMLGLFIGVIIGLKLLIAEKKRLKGNSGGGSVIKPPEKVMVSTGIVALLCGLIVIPYYFDKSDMNELGLIFLLAAIIGIANQRSRFCIVGAIRNPFMTGDGDMTKAVIATFIVTITGFSVIKFFEIAEVHEHVASSVGWPALIGGIIFGVGMSIAGGCASGSLWRAGEGHIKLMLAVIFFSLSAGFTHFVLQYYLEYSYVKKVFLPEVWNSWLAAFAVVFGILYLWYWIVSWNEKTEKLVIME